MMFLLSRDKYSSGGISVPGASPFLGGERLLLGVIKSAEQSSQVWLALDVIYTQLILNFAFVYMLVSLTDYLLTYRFIIFHYW